MADAEGSGNSSATAPAGANNEILRAYFRGSSRNELFDAIFGNSIPGVEKALSRGDVDMNQKTGPVLVLHAAAGFASPKLFEILLKEGANATAVDADGSTALHVAAVVGKIAVMYLLVDSGADVHAVTTLGETPLYAATSQDQAEAVEALVAKGADVNHRTLAGATPIHCAVDQNQLGMVKVLLRAKADLTIRVGEYHPWELALSRGYSEVLEEILKEMIPLVKLEDCGGRGAAALQHAAFENMPRVIPLLYAAGARDTDGEALCLAISNRKEACVKALLELGDSETCVRRYIKSARYTGHGWLNHCVLPVFSNKPSPRIARLLMNSGADTTSTALATCRDHLEGSTPFETTPAGFIAKTLDVSKERGFGDETLFGLKKILCLFRQTPAVHATSWLWPKDAGAGAAAGAAAAAKSKRGKKSAAIVRMLPVFRVKERRVLLTARYSAKQDGQFLGHGSEEKDETRKKTKALEPERRQRKT